MKLAPHIPIERCRLVKYNYLYDVIDQSFDLDEVSFIYPVIPIVIIILLLNLVSASNYWTAYGWDWILSFFWIILRNL